MILEKKNRRRCGSCGKKRALAQTDARSTCCNERVRRIMITTGSGKGVRIVCRKCGKVTKDV